MKQLLNGQIFINFIYFPSAIKRDNHRIANENKQRKIYNFMGQNVKANFTNKCNLI